MGNALKSIAICVVASISVTVDAFGADAPTASANSVVVEQVGNGRFRLVNNSTENVTYMQFINLDAPVVYCKAAAGNARLCAREQYLLAHGKPAEKEALLAPGKSISFKANGRKADAVGVSLSINGEQRFLWQAR